MDCKDNEFSWLVYYNAVKQGDVQSVANYLRQGVDMRIELDARENSIDVATKLGHADLVKLLINHSTFKSFDAFEQYELHYRIFCATLRYGHSDVLKVILDATSGREEKFAKVSLHPHEAYDDQIYIGENETIIKLLLNAEHIELFHDIPIAIMYGQTVLLKILIDFYCFSMEFVNSKTYPDPWLTQCALCNVEGLSRHFDNGSIDKAKMEDLLCVAFGTGDEVMLRYVFGKAKEMFAEDIDELRSLIGKREWAVYGLVELGHTHALKVFIEMEREDGTTYFPWSEGKALFYSCCYNMHYFIKPDMVKIIVDRMVEVIGLPGTMRDLSEQFQLFLTSCNTAVVSYILKEWPDAVENSMVDSGHVCTDMMPSFIDKGIQFSGESQFGKRIVDEFFTGVIYMREAPFVEAEFIRANTYQIPLPAMEFILEYMRKNKILENGEPLNTYLSEHALLHPSWKCVPSSTWSHAYANATATIKLMSKYCQFPVTSDLMCLVDKINEQDTTIHVGQVAKLVAAFRWIDPSDIFLEMNWATLLTGWYGNHLLTGYSYGSRESFYIFIRDVLLAMVGTRLVKLNVTGTKKLISVYSAMTDYFIQLFGHCGFAVEDQLDNDETLPDRVRKLRHLAMTPLSSLCRLAVLRHLRRNHRGVLLCELVKLLEGDLTREMIEFLQFTDMKQAWNLLKLN